MIHISKRPLIPARLPLLLRLRSLVQPVGLGSSRIHLVVEKSEVNRADSFLLGRHADVLPVVLLHRNLFGLESRLDEVLLRLYTLRLVHFLLLGVHPLGQF